MVGVLAAPRPAVGGNSNGTGGATRARSLLAVHLAGLMATAIPTGALLGGAARLLGAPPPATAAAVFGLVALAYGLHDLRLIRLPHPERRVQVPNRWRRSGAPLLTAFGYGLGLGPGFLVYVRSGAYFAVVIGVLLSGSIQLGIAALVAIAIGRAVFLAGAQQYRARAERADALLLAMGGLDQRVRLATGGMLVAAGFMLVVHGGGIASGAW